MACIFADPVAVHAHNAESVLLRKRQAVRVMKAFRFLFEHLVKNLECDILDWQLLKFALGRVLLINDFGIGIEKNGLSVIQRPLERVFDLFLCLFLRFRARRAKVDECGHSHFARNS